ncbi:sigma-70 family RNA polymerase sigma factor [Roseomonas elaeocarpi]|uniref:Sigma-70 family RNA polymerase sigma factor n=1 Tax=Roseomonas elaeocarpi TaxID=907779 RepID=A0ABV6JLQ6_9PROT
MAGTRKRFDVEEQIPFLRRYARVLARHAADADDLVQEALVRAYDRRAAFRIGGNLRAWLLSITYSTFVDGWRSRRSERVREGDYATIQPREADPTQLDHVHLRQIEEAFLLLPDDQRAAFHLVVVEGLSYEDAAAALGVPTGTVMSRLSRARAALRGVEHADSRDGSATRKLPPGEPRLRVVSSRGGSNG